MKKRRNKLVARVVNQPVQPAPAKGKTNAEYANFKVCAKSHGCTMILETGLTKVNAHIMRERLVEIVHGKKANVQFIIIH